MYHVYCDYTEDEHNLYYVGYGVKARVLGTKRNIKHQNIKNKHGLIRKVVWVGTSKACAQAIEKKLIAEFHTFIDDPLANKWACNFTTGGDSGSKVRFKPKSAEWKAKRSLAMKGPNNPMYGKPNPHLTALNVSRTGKPNPMKNETRLKLSKARKGQAPWNKGKKIKSSQPELEHPEEKVS